RAHHRAGDDVAGYLGRHPRRDRRSRAERDEHLKTQNKPCREKHAVIPFEMVEPRSLKEAVSLLDPEEPTIRAVAGGTALMLMMKAGVFKPTRLICLTGLEPEHSRITT